MTDQLTTCEHCGGDCAYVIENAPTIKTYTCFGCGYTTNSLMKNGEEFYNQQMEILPELYKDVQFTDKNGLVWIPNTVNIPEKGMVFYNGTSKHNAKWAAVKSVQVTEEEKEKFPIKGKPGEYYKWRMSMETLKPFEPKEFIEALNYIEVFPK